MKILYYFLYLWVSFALLDLDPATHIIADSCGSGSTTLKYVMLHGLLCLPRISESLFHLDYSSETILGRLNH
jgi:hypothetical protein